jgi:hypothetical protein
LAQMIQKTLICDGWCAISFIPRMHAAISDTIASAAMRQQQSFEGARARGVTSSSTYKQKKRHRCGDAPKAHEFFCLSAAASSGTWLLASRGVPQPLPPSQWCVNLHSF